MMVREQEARHHMMEVTRLICTFCHEQVDDPATHIEENHMDEFEKRLLAEEHDTGKVGRNGHEGATAEFCPRCEPESGVNAEGDTTE